MGTTFIRFLFVLPGSVGYLHLVVTCGPLAKSMCVIHGTFVVQGTHSGITLHPQYALIGISISTHKYIRNEIPHLRSMFRFSRTNEGLQQRTFIHELRGILQEEISALANKHQPLEHNVCVGACALSCSTHGTFHTNCSPWLKWPFWSYRPPCGEGAPCYQQRLDFRASPLPLLPSCCRSLST